MRAGRVALGGAVGTVAVAGAAASVMVVQGLVAKRRRYLSSDLAPPASGTFGSGRTLRLVVFGDSTAAGIGVKSTTETVGGRLAELLAAAGRRVELTSVAVSGSRASDLHAQVNRALVHGAPDVAVVLVGGEDAIAFTPIDVVEAEIEDALRRLTAAGAAVVVGTCPDLAAARNFSRPLREIMAWSGRRVAAVTERATVRAGGVAVDLATRAGAVFRADPGALSADGYHPSADGYQLWALALYPAVFEACRAGSTRG
ncbi:MAG TPA: SGNH/GDSL hydrolase family protein [Cryptosporangiaceae bacterium]|nr:SGNH/GDSL hydrolase family protein [Cryptosporangiaceae bacterium]